MEKGLRTQARRVLLQQVAPAYHQASGSQKQEILEAFLTTTGYVRKYALWLLNHAEEVLAPPADLRRRYEPEVEEALALVWKTLNQHKRLGQGAWPHVIRHCFGYSLTRDQRCHHSSSKPPP